MQNRVRLNFPQDRKHNKMGGEVQLKEIGQFVHQNQLEVMLYEVGMHDRGSLSI